ncbi:MAG TPA: pentapeptide repeat-containing protein [Rhizomicrobium sp.]|jgi:hypothetical protein|nr:pentapeptide repeat-containing protein [Rhizomicrobium sp.]
MDETLLNALRAAFVHRAWPDIRRAEDFENATANLYAVPPEGAMALLPALLAWPLTNPTDVSQIKDLILVLDIGVWRPDWKPGSRPDLARPVGLKQFMGLTTREVRAVGDWLKHMKQMHPSLAELYPLNSAIAHWQGRAESFAGLRDKTLIVSDRNGNALHALTVDGPFAFGDAALGGADFSGMPLAGADFIGADLRGARFDGCDLYWALFFRADLEGASLRRAGLFGCDLKDANLRGADLTHADLGPDNLGGFTDLEGANLTGCKIAGTRFFGASYDAKTRLPADLNPRDHAMTFKPDTGEQR